jgi:hypothetical protein
MGFLDDVKRAFNIGGCKLTINTNGLSFPQGTPVEGTVHLERGGLDQTCSLMSIELEEFWTESRGSGKNRQLFCRFGEKVKPPFAETCAFVFK